MLRVRRWIVWNPPPDKQLAVVKGEGVHVGGGLLAAVTEDLVDLAVSAEARLGRAVSGGDVSCQHAAGLLKRPRKELPTVDGERRVSRPWVKRKRTVI